MTKRLAAPDRDKALADISGWTLAADAKSIHKSFRFADFSAAFGWMTRVALAAEAMNHHPDWSNVYATVTVSLSTHDADGLTRRDFDLAAIMDRLCDQLS
jgi:4a-hydroxytetrahydrobiopterin dehydratase